MGCSIPGCGASDHNRRTHHRHGVPGDPLIDQPGPVEAEVPTGADRAREALREARTDHLVGERGPELITREQAEQLWPDRVVVESDGSWSVDAVTVQGVHGPGPSSEGDHVCEPAPDQVYFCRHCGEDLMVEDDAPEPWITPPWRTVLGPDEPIRITQPGVYELEAHEYHSPAITGDWISNSDLRAMTAPHCPAKWKYNRDNSVRVTSEAFAFGHAWHARVLGKGETIAVRPLVDPSDPTSEWNDWRKNAAKAWRAEQEAAGRSVILPEDWAAVDAMAIAIHEREEAGRLLAQPGRPELAMFWVDQATGVKRRALVDFMPDRVSADGVLEIVDIKSTDSASPDEDMERKIYKYGYHRQGTTIVDGAIALGLADVAVVTFIFQEKTAPYLVQEVVLDTEAERIGGIENHRALLVYKECLETGAWPSYAPSTVPMGIPAYVARLFEDELEMVVR